MSGLRTHQGCGGFVPLLGYPAAACHGYPSVPCVYQCIPFPKNTSGERLKRSPDVLPYGWRCRYFFFFATFFAGAFLAAFLVAICLFSLSMTCIDSANLTADEECIDSRIASVKKKTT
jgi:hypothetical protein